MGRATEIFNYAKEPDLKGKYWMKYAWIDLQDARVKKFRKDYIQIIKEREKCLLIKESCPKLF